MNRCIGGGGNKHYLGHAYHDGLKSFVFSNVMFCVMKTSQKPSDLLDRGQWTISRKDGWKTAGNK